MQLVWLSFLFLGTLVSSSQAQTCDWPFPTYNLTGLTFCDFLNGQQADLFFGGSGASIFDGLIENAWNDVRDYVSSVASANGFTMCDSCMDELKKMLCVTAFPRAGYWDCFMSETAKFWSQVCGAYCPKVGPCCFVCPESEPTCANREISIPTTEEALRCGQQTQANIDQYFDALQTCASTYGPSKEICEDYVSVCTCGQNSGANFCSYYGWSETQFKPTNLPPKGPNCNWCTSEERDLQKKATHMALTKAISLRESLFNVGKRQSNNGVFQVNQNLVLGGVPSGVTPSQPLGLFATPSSPGVCVTPQQQNCAWNTAKEAENNNAGVSIQMMALSTIGFLFWQLIQICL